MAPARCPACGIHTRRLKGVLSTIALGRTIAAVAGTTVSGMANTSPAPDRVRLDDLTDLASAVPHLLGFHPDDSLVAIALRGPRERLSFTMRLDLLEPEYDAEVATMTAERMTHAEADAVLLFLYTQAPTTGERLPRRALVEALQDALDVPVREAMLVDDGRVWSYNCDDVRCCPPEGRELRPDSPGALALAAAHALHGNAVLPSREAVVATTRAVGGVTAVSMRQAIARALVRDEPSDDWLELLCERMADSRDGLSHDEAAELVVGLHDIAFRDHLISRLASGDDVLDRVIGAAAHLAQPPYDAPVASVLAMAAYFRGEGVVAMAAAERALATDPDYSLAELVVEALQRQVAPAGVREVWRRGVAEADVT